MKRFVKASFCLMLTGLFIIGCNDEENDTIPIPILPYSLVLEDSDYALVDGYVINSGPDDPLEMGNNTHTNYELGLSDAPFVLITESDGDQYFGGSNGVSIILSADLYGPDSNEVSGLYTYFDEDTATSNDLLDKYVFSGGEIELDDDKMIQDGELDGDEFEIVGGTINVLGMSPDYEVLIDIMVEGEDSTEVFRVTGNYAGTFQLLED